MRVGDVNDFAGERNNENKRFFFLVLTGTNNVFYQTSMFFSIVNFHSLEDF